MSNTVPDQHVHTTPQGNELRAELLHDAQGTQVVKLQVVDPQTGIIRTLPPEVATTFRDALLAANIKERAEGDLARLTESQRQLQDRLGPYVQNIAGQAEEILRTEELLQVAELRAQHLNRTVDRVADALVNGQPDHGGVPNAKPGATRQL